jgi:hypothetical protein
MWMEKERYSAKKDLLTKSGKWLKRITHSNVQKVPGLWFPRTIIYKDLLKDGPLSGMIVQGI